jgi:hypothetical protein
MSDAFRGACLCGTVKFEVTPPTKWCAHCHCSMCRRAHGAGVVTWVGVPEAQFRVTAGESAVVRYDSSPGAYRRFCGKCGTQLFFAGKRWPGEVHIALATFEGDIDRQPQAHAYFDRHVGWLPWDDALPKYGGSSGTEPLFSQG